jgi:hypothetical protein
MEGADRSSGFMSDCKCGSGLPATLLRNIILEGEGGITAVRLFCSECAPKPEYWSGGQRWISGELEELEELEGGKGRGGSLKN